MTIRVMRFFIFGSMPTPSGFAISSASLKLLSTCRHKKSCREDEQEDETNRTRDGSARMPYFFVLLYILYVTSINHPEGVRCE